MFEAFAMIFYEFGLKYRIKFNEGILVANEKGGGGEGEVH